MAGKLTNRMDRIHKTSMLIGCGVGAFLAVFPRLAVGSPLTILRLSGADALIPPLWLMSLLWLAVCVLLGAAAGIALSCVGRSGMQDALRWRGMTFLVVEVTFSFAWYSLSFGSFLLLPSCLCLLGAVAAGGLCTLSWISAQRSAAILSLTGVLWHLWLLLLQIAVILHN